MLQLVATFTDLVCVVQNAVHGPRGTVINPFVEECGLDLSRSLIDEAWRVENVENALAFRAGERPRRRASRLRHFRRTRSLLASVVPGA
jgi:hypothetical protein